jgi:bacteriocin biosynthesis cyclodehydratase domain-containing protein
MSQTTESTELWTMRPKLRHDVVFLEAPAGVYLRGADTTFVLKGRQAYRWLATLAPYLTGEHALGELCATLDASHRQTVGNLITSLTARGMVKDAGPAAELAEPVARRFASAIEFIDHFTDDATGRFRRFREAGIVVAGAGAALTAAALGLLRNGSAHIDVRPVDDVAAHQQALVPEADALRADNVPTDLTIGPGSVADLDLAGVDALIYCAQDGDLRAVLDLARRCHAAGTYFVPVVFVAGRAVLGPVTAPGTAPCWLCAHLRLTTNADGGAGSETWRQIVLGPLAAGLPAVPDVLAGMVGNAAAFELFRTFTGALRAETASAVVIQDLDTLEASHHHVLPHPACPICAETDAGIAAAPALDPVSDEAIYVRAEALVSVESGVFHSFLDDALEQSPLKNGRLRFSTPDRPGRPREITAFSTENVMQARLTAYHAGASAYVSRVGIAAGARDGTATGLRARGGSPVPWTELATGGGVVPFDPEQAITWLPARALDTGDTMDVPAAAVFAFSNHNRRGYAHRTSAGAAAGHTTADVIAAGLRSALAYTALRAAVEGRAGRVDIPAERLAADPELEFLAVSAGRLGHRLALYALTGAAPAAAVLAVAEPVENPAGTATPPKRPLWSLAGGFGLGEALAAAVRDVVGQVQIRHFEAVEADLGDPLFPDFDPRTSLPAVAGPVPGDAACTVEDVIAALSARGITPLFTETTTPDLRAVGAFRTGTVLLRQAATRDSPAA